jgi:type IX secretion system PorP/SprF family membrane protein
MPQSPLTGLISLEGPLKNPKFENMGVGGMLYTDQMHIIRRIGGLGSYAYHVPFDKEKNHGLSAGMSLGFLYQRLNFAEATVYSDNDVQVLADASNGLSFDFSLGLDYHYKSLHLGVSMLQGLNNSLKFIQPNDTVSIKFINTRHFILMGSYRFELGSAESKNQLYIEPVFLGRMVQGLPFQAELTANVGMKNIGWLGLGYRSSNTETATSALSATLGLELNPRLLAAYTVDFGLSKSLNASMGSQHELMIMYRFGKDGKEDAKLKAELEELKRKDDELQKELQTRTEQMNKALDEEKTAAKAREEALRGELDDVKKDNGKLKDDIIRSQEDLDRLKKELADKKITHKHIGEVFFAPNSDKMSEEIKSHLSSMKEALDKYPKGLIVYIYGNASVEGDAKYNMELAVRRGAAVRQYLLEKGVNAKKVYVIPMGEYNPLGADPKRIETKDRRVDIMVHQED